MSLVNADCDRCRRLPGRAAAPLLMPIPTAVRQRLVLHYLKDRGAPSRLWLALLYNTSTVALVQCDIEYHRYHTYILVLVSVGHTSLNVPPLAGVPVRSAPKTLSPTRSYISLIDIQIGFDFLSGTSIRCRIKLCPTFSTCDRKRRRWWRHAARLPHVTGTWRTCRRFCPLAGWSAPPLNSERPPADRSACLPDCCSAVVPGRNPIWHRVCGSAWEPPPGGRHAVCRTPFVSPGRCAGNGRYVVRAADTGRCCAVWAGPWVHTRSCQWSIQPGV